MPLTTITAWEALFDRLQLSDQTEGSLLVVGATGGVGHWELMFTRPQVQTPDMVGQHTLLCVTADLVDAGRLHSTVTRRLDGLGAANPRERVPRSRPAKPSASSS